MGYSEDLEDYRILLSQIISGEQKRIKEVMEANLEGGIDNYTIKELLIYLHDNVKEINNLLI